MIGNNVVDNETIMQIGNAFLSEYFSDDGKNISDFHSFFLSLTENQKECLRLRYILCYNDRQISKILNVSPQAVSQRFKGIQKKYEKYSIKNNEIVKKNSGEISYKGLFDIFLDYYFKNLSEKEIRRLKMYYDVLSEEEKNMLKLRLVNGLSFLDCDKALNKPNGSTNQTLKSIGSRLKKRLKEEARIYVVDDWVFYFLNYIYGSQVYTIDDLHFFLKVCKNLPRQEKYYIYSYVFYDFDLNTCASNLSVSKDKLKDIINKFILLCDPYFKTNYRFVCKSPLLYLKSDWYMLKEKKLNLTLLDKKYDLDKFPNGRGHLFYYNYLQNKEIDCKTNKKYNEVTYLDVLQIIMWNPDWYNCKLSALKYVDSVPYGITNIGFYTVICLYYELYKCGVLNVDEYVYLVMKYK